MPDAERAVPKLVPAIDTAERFLRDVGTIRDARGEICRDSYGHGENAAHAILKRHCDEAGLRWSTDAACNAYVDLEGRDPGRRIIIGSHLDSVPSGGNFDGAAGIAAGLAVLSGFVRAAALPDVTLTVMAIRAEESTWFSGSYLGSRAALGTLDGGELDTLLRGDTGRSLAWHIARSGGDPDALRSGAPHLRPDEIVAFVEPHIEQGPVLVREGQPVALVSGTRGSFRYRAASCLGAYAHSGATPREFRQDAALATARLVCAADEAWRRREAAGEDLAVTFGQLATDPAEHAFSKVAGRTDFSVDVRSASPGTLLSFHEELLDMAAAIERRCGVRFDLGTKTSSEPARFSEELTARLLGSFDACAIRRRILASGAGHDAAAFAQAGVQSIMIFIRNRNGSHNPNESMEIDDLASAASVLLDYCRDPFA